MVLVECATWMELFITRPTEVPTRLAAVWSGQNLFASPATTPLPLYLKRSFLLVETSNNVPCSRDTRRQVVSPNEI